MLVDVGPEEAGEMLLGSGDFLLTARQEEHIGVVVLVEVMAGLVDDGTLLQPPEYVVDRSTSASAGGAQQAGPTTTTSKSAGFGVDGIGLLSIVAAHPVATAVGGGCRMEGR